MRAGPLLALLGVAACSLITPFDDLTRGSGAPVDGGADAIDATPATADATAEASTDAPETGGRFCVVGAHAFCSDFDGDELDKLAVFTRKVDLPGTLEVSATRAASTPNSIHARSPRLGASERRYVTVVKTLEVSWRHALVDFDVYIQSPTFEAGDSNFGIVGVTFRSSGGDQDVALSVAETGTTLGVSSGGAYLANRAVDAAPMVLDAWVHVHLELVPSGTIQVTAGTNTYSTSWPTLVPGSVQSLEVEVGILGYNAPAPEAEVFVDNVVVDFP